MANAKVAAKTATWEVSQDGGSSFNTINGITDFSMSNSPTDADVTDFGSGVNTIHLLKCGYLITAIDVVKYNKFKLMNKLNNSQKKKLKLDILNLKSNRLPYKNNSFDHIVAMSVISLLGNENSVKRLLSEFVRVLKPNGKLIIDINDHESEFSKNSQQIRKNIFLTKLVDKKIKTFCLKNISQFKKLISKYFKVIDAGYTSHRVFKRKITEFIICAINSK